MGRPRNEEETKQLSIKMPASERDRLLEVAFHESGKANPEDVNLSQWVRERLAEMMDDYEARFPNGRVVIHQNYVDAVVRVFEHRVAAMTGSRETEENRGARDSQSSTINTPKV